MYQTRKDTKHVPYPNYPSGGRRKGVPIHEDGMDLDAWLGDISDVWPQATQWPTLNMGMSENGVYSQWNSHLKTG